MTSARWQSSQQPLFVRTVWVRGRRHAILSRDDPLLRFPMPSASSSSSGNSSENGSCCQLEDCLIKLRLALRPDSYQDTFHRSPYPVRQGSVESSECYRYGDSEEESVGGGQPPLLGRYPEVFTLDASSPLPYEPQLNPLSERVLQWLDLSGKSSRLPVPSEPPQERRKLFTFEIRKTLKSRQRELTARSLSVDVLANLKLSARSKATHEKRKRNVVTPCSSPEEAEAEGSGFDEPQPKPEFEPPRLLRSNVWPQPASPAPVRPQLHIFMPHLGDEANSEAEGL